MTKKQSTVLLFIFLALNLLLLALNIEMHEDAANLSADLEETLVDRTHEVQELRFENQLLESQLADTQEELQVSLWKLSQIEARNEGVKYQEGEE